MKQETFRRELSDLTPDMPEVFRQRVEAFLQEKVDQEVNMKESTKRALYMGGRFSSRALIFALVAMLMLGSVAFAATRWGIFDTLSWLGTQPPTADSVMQGKLHTETVNGVEITIEEAGYDGRTLFLQYSYRFPGMTKQLGEVMGEKGIRMLTEEDLALFDQHNVGWWIDAFWVNGQCMDMAGGSGSDDRPGENPGEMIRTEYWRLDNMDVKLTGEVEIALPIGDRQPLSEYSLLDHPEKYDADKNLIKPDQGLVTFTFDAKDTLSRVVRTNPNIATVTPDVTVRVSEAAYTPLMTYINLTMEPNPDSIAAYKDEHGEGWLDEEGNLLWAYTGMDVYGAWISSLQLVDGEGKVIFLDNGGCNSSGETWAEFIYPYMDPANLPEQLWLAPVNGGVADMTCAIRVK
ncbi:MAG: hypothetical protein IJD39_12470 [Clostridia bacterium]|nr:hypothetical protein [Clostridia bacterium]